MNVSTSKGWNPFKNVDEQQKEFPLQIVSGKNEQVQVVPLITPGSSSSAQIEPELILSKVQPLSAYLNKLLKFHEIVASDEFLLFLDEEAKDMKSNVKNLEALSIHDILLMRVSYNKCTVRKSEEASFKVLKGQIVVWQFSTEGYDIGFSVSVNGQTKISLTRYNSHQKVASGSLEVTEDGKVTLCWDNSHARLRSKKLAWVAKVLSQEDYNNAKVQALEIQVIRILISLLIIITIIIISVKSVSLRLNGIVFKEQRWQWQRQCPVLSTVPLLYTNTQKKILLR